MHIKGVITDELRDFIRIKSGAVDDKTGFDLFVFGGDFVSVFRFRYAANRKVAL